MRSEYGELPMARERRRIEEGRMKSFDGDVDVAKVECSRRVVNVGGGRVKESQVTKRGWCRPELARA
jgi:hypothetical protein